jgi:hypothetical protein
MSTPCRCHEDATSPSGGGVLAEAPFTAFGAEAVALPLAHESPEQSSVRLAIAGGTRDVNVLTNRVFSARHPERGGRALSPSEPGFAGLAAEWTTIRDTVVRPLLTAAPATGTGLWVSGAERLANPKSAGGTYVDAPWRFVFHTIEGEPTAQGFRTLAAGHANPPHLWAMPSADLLLQTIPLDRSAYALARPGSIQTNRARAVQVECWGFAAKMGGATPETLAWLADRVLGPVARLVPIDLDHVRPAGPGEPCYGEKSSCRMEPAAWQAFGGVCGHKDVPDNAHWDPGQLPLADIAARAKATRGGTSYIRQERPLGDHDGPAFAAERDDHEEPSFLAGQNGHLTESWTGFLGEEFEPGPPPSFAEARATSGAPSMTPFVLPALAGAPTSSLAWETPWAQQVESLTTDEVRWVQSTLNRVIGAGLAVDGVFGPLTRTAVMTFQRREGLVVDGIVGPVTTAALQRATTGRPRTTPSPPAGYPAPSRGGAALPLPRAAIGDLARLVKPHHDYPAVDLSAPKGTPIYACVGGTVRRAGVVGGYGSHTVYIEDADGFTWIYGHGSAHHVAVGQVVPAGHHIADVGNEGQSTGDHLHLEIEDRHSVEYCPQTFLAAVWNGQTPPSVASLPTSGCSY